MKTFGLHTQRSRACMVALFSLLVCNAVWAGTNYDYVDAIDPSRTAAVTYEPDGGYYTIEFKYYYNPTNSAKDVSLTESSYINATWNGQDHTIMKLKGCSDCEYVDFRSAAQGPADGYVYANNDWRTSGTFSQNVSDGNAAKASFRWYPPETALGYTPSFYFNFQIEEDEDGEGSLNRTARISPNITLPVINSKNLTLVHGYSATDVNKLDLKVTFTGGSVPKNLYWGAVELGFGGRYRKP